MFVSKPANEAVVLCFTIFLNQKDRQSLVYSIVRPGLYSVKCTSEGGFVFYLNKLFSKIRNSFTHKCLQRWNECTDVYIACVHLSTRGSYLLQDSVTYSYRHTNIFLFYSNIHTLTLGWMTLRQLWVQKIDHGGFDM